MTDPDDELLARFDAWCRHQDDADDAMQRCIVEARSDTTAIHRTERR